VADDYEIVLVNDASRDRTWELIVDLVEKDPNLVGVSLTRNHGHQLALTAGLNLCAGERVFIIDADLQDPPELLGEMMRLMDTGADVVYGRRKQRRGEGPFKKLSAAAFYRVFNHMADLKLPVDTGDFRLMSRRAVELLNQMPEHQRFIRGLVSWIGLNQVPLVYERDRRFAGQTNYPFVKMLGLALDAITSFSIKPLRLATYLGLISAVFALGAMVYTLYSWLYLGAVQGWTSVMSVLLLLGSAQLIILGLIGEYLGRLYMESKRRPLFMIDRIIRKPSAPESRF
jgi:dolichol-phosphate mannosyltransferase